MERRKKRNKREIESLQEKKIYYDKKGNNKFF